MRIILITMIFIIFSINYSYGDMQSDIKEIKQNMVTKAEFKMFMELVEKRFEAVDKRFEDMQKYMDKRFEDMNKRFEFIQSLLISLIVIMLGSTVYSIIERKSFITKKELYDINPQNFVFLRKFLLKPQISQIKL